MSELQCGNDLLVMQSYASKHTHWNAFISSQLQISEPSHIKSPHPNIPIENHFSSLKPQILKPQASSFEASSLKFWSLGLKFWSLKPQILKPLVLKSLGAILCNNPPLKTSKFPTFLGEPFCSPVSPPSFIFPPVPAPPLNNGILIFVMLDFSFFRNFDFSRCPVWPRFASTACMDRWIIRFASIYRKLCKKLRLVPLVKIWLNTRIHTIHVWYIWYRKYMY